VKSFIYVTFIDAVISYEKEIMYIYANLYTSCIDYMPYCIQKFYVLIELIIFAQSRISLLTNTDFQHVRNVLHSVIMDF